MPSQNLDELIQAWDAARGAKYTSPDLAPLTVQIIRQLAIGQAVSAEALAATNQRSVAGVHAQLKQLAAEGTELDGHGNVVGSALSLNPTRHRVHVDGQVRYAWCALDTFFLPAYVQQAAQVESICPVSGATIRLSITPEGVAACDPPGTVVSIYIPRVKAEHQADVQAGPHGPVCGTMHFFSSGDVAATWLVTHPDAMLLSVAEAWQLAWAVFIEPMRPYLARHARESGQDHGRATHL
jgi:alkylmercury lyase